MATLTYRDTTVTIEPGRDILGQLLDAGAEVGYICMAGSCGACKVRVLQGGEYLRDLTDAERRHCRGQPEHRLGCQAITTGNGDVVVEQ